MTQTWNAAKVDDVKYFGLRAKELAWPITVEEIGPLFDSFGWTCLCEDPLVYDAGYDVRPSAVMHTEFQGELHSLRLSLVDRAEKESAEREQFVRNHASAYVLALKDALGPSEIPPYYLRPRGTNKSVWNFADGSRLVLTSSMSGIVLELESPLRAEVQRDQERHPEAYKEG